MKAPAPRQKSEHEEQREFVSWFRKTYGSVRIFAIPNGGHRNLATAARLKAEGVSPGVPDLYVPEWKLWIEMKKSKGSTTSDHQNDWIAYLIKAKNTVIVAYGAEQAKKEVIKFYQEIK